MNRAVIKYLVSAFLVIIAHGSLAFTPINQKNCDQVIDKKFYKICYDYRMKGARYVSYTLRGDQVNAVNIKPRPRFYPELSIPERYRTKYQDYTHNAFQADRGHLAPDAAFDYSPRSLHSVYSMANIIPQYKWVNRKTWVKAERYARQMAVKLGSVTVINGVEYGSNPRRLRRSGIAYPKAFWKMIFNNDQGFQRCLYYRNSRDVDYRSDRLKDHVVDCAKFGLAPP